MMLLMLLIVVPTVAAPQKCLYLVFACLADIILLNCIHLTKDGYDIPPGCGDINLQHFLNVYLKIS